MRIALIIGDFEDGGVERTLTHLAAGLARLGVAVDLLVGRTRHAYLNGLPDSLRRWPLEGARETAIAAYLEARQPDLLMTGKRADERAALAARSPQEPRPLLLTTVGTPLSARQAAYRWNLPKRWRERRQIAADYRRLDGITTVSEAVADDLRRHFGITGVPVRVLPNPIVPEDVGARAARPCPHPWLAPHQPPVILAVGGLRKVKDFSTLVRAFARLPEGAVVNAGGAPAVRPRLLILGEGKERERLRRLIQRLGLTGRVELPGFVADPYPYLARARLLVLSSRREGLGNVLVEALAVGTPVVATDCPGGVRELLQGGRLGALVPVGDERALAAAISSTLAAPPDAGGLRDAAAPYAIERAARAYLAFFEQLLQGRTSHVQ